MNAIAPLSAQSYEALAQELGAFIPSDRLIRDPLRTLAYGTDGSFYRLIPQIVVKAEGEAEVLKIIAACRKHNKPITFRAAGTSLSGQAVTDSVLLILGDSWDGVKIEDQGKVIRLQPGVIGAEANRRLSAFSRKIGPDPASIDSAKIGGIAANNSSGMCCGTADNSYKTLLSMRVVLADGTLLDTGSPESVAAFRESHKDLLATLDALGRQARENTVLAERIRHKYSVKNTTGYGLNALVDFEDPIEILQHLMIGSEGTLGFIAEVTYRTVVDHAHKASALFMFGDIRTACSAVPVLRQTPVSAVELLDTSSLRAVEDMKGVPDFIKGVADGTNALLVETRAETAEQLAANMAEIERSMDGFTLLRPPAFTTDPAVFGSYWAIRKGLFPAVGAVRKTGTTVIIEDIAVDVKFLADAIGDLVVLLKKYNYDEAVIFGHALDGNVHFVFTQDFAIQSEVDRYSAFMSEMADMLTSKYDGALKAEHGTGRNMAPFVEMEWGKEAYSLMLGIKHVFDPENLLNPGVIINDDNLAHLKNLKPLPAADSLVDTCIECGFCERMCPSHQLTLSPRQRIVGWREISRLSATGDDPQREAELRGLYDYMGMETCAACGLCALACPVGIETGALIKSLRGRMADQKDQKRAEYMAQRFASVTNAARMGLKVASAVDGVLGKGTAQKVANFGHKVSGGKLPKLGASLPKAAEMPVAAKMGVAMGEGTEVVYLPTCATRIMGPLANQPEQDSVPQRISQLLTKAGFKVIFPQGMNDLCCGMSFESKGQMDAANAKASQLEAALLKASDNGRIPVLLDASACSLRTKQALSDKLVIKDSIEFLYDEVLPRLDIEKQKDPVLVHINCSARRQGLDTKMVALAKACAHEVIVPPDVLCCGFAGDKGYTTPELNDHALRKLDRSVEDRCEGGYSSNRTCEIGLSDHSGKPYRSIAYLLDRVSKPKK